MGWAAAGTLGCLQSETHRGQRPSAIRFLLLNMVSAVPCAQGWVTCVVGEWHHLFPRVPEPAAGPTQLLSLCTIGVSLAVFQVCPLLLTVSYLLVMAPILAPTGMWEQHRSDSRDLSHSAWCTLSQSCENLP